MRHFMILKALLRPIHCLQKLHRARRDLQKGIQSAEKTLHGLLSSSRDDLKYALKYAKAYEIR